MNKCQYCGAPVNVDFSSLEQNQEILNSLQTGFTNTNENGGLSKYDMNFDR